MVLYLCKMDPNVAGDAKFVAVIGHIIGDDARGYRFLPNTSRHKASRRAWASVNSCIPNWTERCGFLRLLDQSEINAATKPSAFIEKTSWCDCEGQRVSHGTCAECDDV